eukprot:TRINITY_DN37761_c0_g1_i1.p1 TRINITY_DN37761_c0_g1~~TRINITY_DN37761_c0_g1_i1.p1  ORF type:complete len:872 (+),score=175.65 TRINITY_DN37761_c0_g1_i1:152-2767(+)
MSSSPLLHSDGGDARDSAKRSARISTDWLALFLGPAISVPFAACYAALVCRRPELQPHFPVVLQQVMWTQLAGSIVALFVGQFVTTTNLDPLTAILFGQLSGRVMDHFRGPAMVFLLPNMLLVMPIMTVCLGLALYAVGRFKLAFMLRFFPYTVVGGFLAGSGMLILQESLSLAAGVEIWDLIRLTLPGQISHDGEAQFSEAVGCWAQIGLAVIFSFFMEFVREMHVFGTPLLMVAAVGISLLVEAWSGGSIPPRSWFLKFPDPVNWWEPFELLAQGLGGDFRPAQAIDLDFTAAFVAIMTVSWSINTLAVAKLVPLRPGLQRCEEQDEIRSLGLTNIILGGLGCYSSMQSFKIPMIMRGVKSGPTWPFFNVIVNIVLFLASPRAIIICVPRFLFAGSVVRLSTDLINEWLLEARRRIAQKEWYVLAATALVVYANVTLGILFGLFLTLVLFAVEYSGVTGVIGEGSLVETRSNVERSEDEHEVLCKHGGSTHVFWLSGYFFFGSATQVADEVRAVVQDKGVTVVILDFALVPAMDASGVYAIVDLAAELADSPRKARLVLCSLVRRLHMALQSAAEHQEVKSIELYHDLDEALECCEKLILVDAALALEQTPVRKHSSWSVSKINSMNCISSMVGAFSRETSEEVDGGIWDQLLADELQELDPGRTAIMCLRQLAGQPRLVDEGTVLFRHGEPASELLVLLSGSVEVTQPSAEPVFQTRLPRHHLNEEKGDVFVFEERQRRVRRARAGAVFGAVEYAASRTPVSSSPSPNGSDSEEDFGSMGSSGSAVLRNTGTAVGGQVEVLVIRFEALRRAERKEHMLALVLRTWLSRLAADALIGLRDRESQHLHGRLQVSHVPTTSHERSPIGSSP